MLLFDIFFITVLQQVCHCKVDVIAGDANAAACMSYKNQEHQDLYDSSIAVMQREMQREVNTGHHLEAGFMWIILPIIIRLSFTQQMILIIVSWRTPVGPRVMSKLWSSITTGQSENLREQTDDRKGKQTEDNSRERGVERQLRAAARQGYPEDAEDPMVAPPDYDIRQSGRVLELQNRDL